MVLRHIGPISRRRVLAATLSAAVGVRFARAAGVKAARKSDLVNPVPYFAQGETGPDSINNCGPASVAAAIAYSGVASPSVQDVRDTLGFYGPTSTDQWTWLLDRYNVPWRATWTRSELETSIAKGEAVIIAAWMGDLSSASDFEQAWSPKEDQVGRYDGFSLGHSMLIAGVTADGGTYLVHDPNVFRSEEIGWYQDRSPKGSYRRYNADEIWRTVSAYAAGFAIAVPPPMTTNDSPADSPTSRQVEDGAGDAQVGPAGGKPADRAELAIRPARFDVPRVLTNALTPSMLGSADGSAAVK